MRCVQDVHQTRLSAGSSLKDAGEQINQLQQQVSSLAQQALSQQDKADHLEQHNTGLQVGSWSGLCVLVFGGCKITTHVL